jgi:alpha-beta hydrolase superfamily lysophospholipase
MLPLPAIDWDTGTGLRGYAWEAREPRANLLLQHGYVEHANRYVAQYHELIPHLVDAGISVYAIDLRGHGRSPGPRFMIDVGDAVTDHLTARHTLRSSPLPLFLLGHSLGGLITACSVLRDPDGVRGVVLSSAVLLEKTNAFLRNVARILGRIAPRVIVRFATPKGITRIPEQLAITAADPLTGVAHVRSRVAASTLELLDELWRNVDRWKTPVLLFHGTADTYTNPVGSQRFFDAIPASDKTLRMFEGGYHELLNDLDRDEVLRLILGWLDARIG